MKKMFLIVFFMFAFACLLSLTACQTLPAEKNITKEPDSDAITSNLQKTVTEPDTNTTAPESKDTPDKPDPEPAKTELSIHPNFVGGNISVQSITGTDVYLKNELRDTTGNWFYWAFCVEGAQGKELTFHFDNNRLGYWGPAVSHDLVNWQWHNQVEGNTFTYRFGADEDKVYFAHSMLYHPDRFLSFAKTHNLTVSELCKSRNGNSVPCVEIGDGDTTIILTARHHACESSGSYVLEGVLEALLTSPIENTRILVVPFVDYDGVVAGDQGKNRAPHDHNRDYGDNAIYPEVKALMAYAEKYGCHYGFDFHSPSHQGDEHDHIYIMRNYKADKISRFSSLLVENYIPGGMSHSPQWNYPASAYDPNGTHSTFHAYMNYRPENILTFTLECTYAGTAENKVSQDSLRIFGNGFAKALNQFVKENNSTAPSSPTESFDKLQLEKNEFLATADKATCEPVNVTVSGAAGGVTVGLYLEQTDGRYKWYGRIVLADLVEGQSKVVSLRDASYKKNTSNGAQPALGLTLDTSKYPNGRGCKLVWFAGESLIEQYWCPVTHQSNTVNFKIVPESKSDEPSKPDEPSKSDEPSKPDEPSKFDEPSKPNALFDKLQPEKVEFVATTDKATCEAVNVTVSGAAGGVTVVLYIEQTDGRYKAFGRFVLADLGENQTQEVSLRDASYKVYNKATDKEAPGLTLDPSKYPNGRGYKLVWFAGDQLANQYWSDTYADSTADFKLVSP